MKYVMVSVFDRATQVFSAPQFVGAAAQALRGFRDQVNARGDANNVVAAHPEDFDLFELGLFDDAAGHFDPWVRFPKGHECYMSEVTTGSVETSGTPVSTPRLIARAKDLVTSSQ